MPLPMTDGEICRSYEQARFPSCQICILAELNDTTRDPLAGILKKNGYTVPQRIRPYIKTKERKNRK